LDGAVDNLESFFPVGKTECKIIRFFYFNEYDASNVVKISG
jgi:hypothetical protein